MNQEAAPKPVGYPDDWHVIDFDQFTTLQRGKDLTRDEFGAGDVPVAGSNGIIGFHHTANVRGPGVTVGRSGSVGRVTFYERDFWAHNTALFVKDYHGNDPRFAAFFLEFLNLARFGSGASVPTLDRNAFRFMPVVVPLEEEQRRIGAVLELAKQAIGLEERQLGLTSELKKSLMRKLFTEGVRGEPQKDTEIGRVPESWKVTSLSEVCTFESGGTPSKKRPDFWEGTIPWVSPKDMKRPILRDVKDHISVEALEDGSKLAPAGSIFIVVRGMILAKDIPVALAAIPMAFNQDIKAIIPGSHLKPEFLLYAMTAYKRKLFEKVGRSAHGTITLMSSEIARFLVPVPPHEEQEEIENAISTVDNKVKIHRQKKELLLSAFRTLLHQLMTAQIRVNDLDLSEIEKLAA